MVGQRDKRVSFCTDGMDFSLRRIGDQNLYYHESDVDSRVQLVFVPGGFNPEIWQHQISYFSRNFRTATFEPTQKDKGFEGEKKALNNILDQEEMKNVVLVSSITGNRLIQEVEGRDEVVATVMTGCMDKEKTDISKRAYRLLWKASLKKPKIMKETFFSDQVKYQVVKDFAEDVTPPSYECFRSFLKNYQIERSLKPSLVAKSDQDRFSNMDDMDNTERSVSTIHHSGTFSFYEKPQEYNKILHDFLEKVRENVESREIIESRKKNRSLFEFESKKKEQNEGKKRRKKRKRKVKAR